MTAQASHHDDEPIGRHAMPAAPRIDADQVIRDAARAAGDAAAAAASERMERLVAGQATMVARLDSVVSANNAVASSIEKMTNRLTLWVLAGVMVFGIAAILAVLVAARPDTSAAVRGGGLGVEINVPPPAVPEPTPAP